jgi:HSP20 family protein
MLGFYHDPFFSEQTDLFDLLLGNRTRQQQQQQQQQRRQEHEEHQLSKPFTWTPRCDLQETPNKFVVTAELAGIPKENIAIQVEDGVLTISGERSMTKESSSENVEMNEKKTEEKRTEEKEKKGEKKGEKKEEKKEEKPVWHRVERTYGAFRRSYTLPENVAIDGISADSKDGVLTIEIPKRVAEKNKPRTITIN